MKDEIVHKIGEEYQCNSEMIRMPRVRIQRSKCNSDFDVPIYLMKCDLEIMRSMCN